MLVKKKKDSREKEKVKSIERRQPTITQMSLAIFEELQASILRHDGASKRERQSLRQYRQRIRQALLNGATVEPGPLHVQLKGRSKRLVVK